MRLKIRHVTRYAYDPPALRLALRLRLWPSRFEAQRPLDWRVSVDGEAVPILFTDVHGESLGLWHAHDPRDAVEIVAEGEVETEDAAGLVRGLGRERGLGLWRRDTALTAPDPGLDALAGAAREAAGGAGRLAELHALMQAVHARVEYRAGLTDADTPAARALALGAGVCQDHTHVFLAAARRLGAPARYVAGYLLASDDPEAAEGPAADPSETHAWAEAHVEGLGWVGFDPSSGVCTTDRHVRLCSGLDARAAGPMRGSVGGGTDETLEAWVDIDRVAAESAQ
ncbi:MAG TPA: transglutaminase domain-containing protein [Paracoccaceae bacterium]|nr:transglutaminase domain-containing protein [Paracoccaceae bacterium]